MRIIISLLLITFSFHMLPNERRAVYQAQIFDGQVIFADSIRITSSGGYFHGHSGYGGMEFCPKNSEWFCTTAMGGIAFPKHGLTMGKTWEFFESKFTVVGKKADMGVTSNLQFDVKFLGTTAKVVAVKVEHSVETGFDKVLLVSKSKGVVGFITDVLSPYYGPNEEPVLVQGIYLLVGDSGLGSESFENRIPEKLRLSNKRGNKFLPRFLPIASTVVNEDKL